MRTGIRYLLLWPALAVLAIGNGVLRETTYAHWMTEPASHRLSTLTAVLLTGGMVFAASRRWPITAAATAWRIGFTWLTLTVAFEWLFGHYVAGHSWQRLLADYDLAAGRVWTLFLLWILLMPVLFRRRD